MTQSSNNENWKNLPNYLKLSDYIVSDGRRIKNIKRDEIININDFKKIKRIYYN